MIRHAVLSVFLCAATSFTGPGIARAQAPADEAGVRRVVQDYLEGFYDGDTTKIIRAVRPEVTKYGFYIPNGETEYAGEPMSFRQMIEYAASVRESGRTAPADAPREIEILDVRDQIAVARLTAWWGMDYLQLARYDGRWMILHVLWQTPPRQ